MQSQWTEKRPLPTGRPSATFTFTSLILAGSPSQMFQSLGRKVQEKRSVKIKHP